MKFVMRKKERVFGIKSNKYGYKSNTGNQQKILNKRLKYS